MIKNLKSSQQAVGSWANPWVAQAKERSLQLRRLFTMESRGSKVGKADLRRLVDDLRSSSPAWQNAKHEFERITEVDIIELEVVKNDYSSGVHSLSNTLDVLNQKIGNGVVALQNDNFVVEYDVRCNLGDKALYEVDCLGLSLQVKWEPAGIKVGLHDSAGKKVPIKQKIQAALPDPDGANLSDLAKELGFAHRDVKDLFAPNVPALLQLFKGNGGGQHKLTRLVKGALMYFDLLEKENHIIVGLEPRWVEYKVGSVLAAARYKNSAFAYSSKPDSLAYNAILYCMCLEYPNQYIPGKKHIKIPADATRVYLVAAEKTEDMGDVMVTSELVFSTMLTYCNDFSLTTEMEEAFAIASALRENKYLERASLPRVISQVDLVAPGLSRMQASLLEKPVMNIPASKILGRVFQMSVLVLMKDVLVSAENTSVTKTPSAINRNVDNYLGRNANCLLNYMENNIGLDVLQRCRSLRWLFHMRPAAMSNIKKVSVLEGFWLVTEPSKVLKNGVIRCLKKGEKNPISITDPHAYLDAYSTFDKEVRLATGRSLAIPNGDFNIRKSCVRSQTFKSAAVDTSGWVKVIGPKFKTLDTQKKKKPEERRSYGIECDYEDEQDLAFAGPSEHNLKMHSFNQDDKAWDKRMKKKVASANLEKLAQLQEQIARQMSLLESGGVEDVVIEDDSEDDGDDGGKEGLPEHEFGNPILTKTLVPSTCKLPKKGSKGGDDDEDDSEEEEENIDTSNPKNYTTQSQDVSSSVQAGSGTEETGDGSDIQEQEGDVPEQEEEIDPSKVVGTALVEGEVNLSGGIKLRTVVRGGTVDVSGIEYQSPRFPARPPIVEVEDDMFTTPKKKMEPFGGTDEDEERRGAEEVKIKKEQIAKSKSKDARLIEASDEQKLLEIEAQSKMRVKTGVEVVTGDVDPDVIIRSGPRLKLKPNVPRFRLPPVPLKNGKLDLKDEDGHPVTALAVSGIMVLTVPEARLVDYDIELTPEAELLWHLSKHVVTGIQPEHSVRVEQFMTHEIAIKAAEVQAPYYDRVSEVDLRLFKENYRPAIQRIVDGIKSRRSLGGTLAELYVAGDSLSPPESDAMKKGAHFDGSVWPGATVDSLRFVAGYICDSLWWRRKVLECHNSTRSMTNDQRRFLVMVLQRGGDFDMWRTLHKLCGGKEFLYTLNWCAVKNIIVSILDTHSAIKSACIIAPPAEILNLRMSDTLKSSLPAGVDLAEFNRTLPTMVKLGNKISVLVAQVIESDVAIGTKEMYYALGLSVKPKKHELEYTRNINKILGIEQLE